MRNKRMLTYVMASLDPLEQVGIPCEVHGTRVPVELDCQQFGNFTRGVGKAGPTRLPEEPQLTLLFCTGGPRGHLAAVARAGPPLWAGSPSHLYLIPVVRAWSPWFSGPGHILYPKSQVEGRLVS